MTSADRRRVRVALALAALAASALVSFRWCYEPDLWWHLAQGREIAAGNLPRTNLFSFTHPDFPQPSTSWLFDLAAYELWRCGGAAAVQLGQTLLVFATLVLLFAACRQRTTTAASAAVVIFGFFILEPRALPRPHTVSFAGMAACALLIEQSRRRGSIRPLLLAVPLVLVWSNLHVESVFGVVLLGCFALEALVRPDDAGRLGWRPLAVTVVAAAALVANPYGVGLVRYLAENARVPTIIRIAELQPPYLPNYASFFAYLIATVGLLLVPPRPRLGELLATAIFATLALRYLRFTPLLLCATAPVVAERLAASVGGARLAPSGASSVPLGASSLPLGASPVPPGASFVRLGALCVPLGALFLGALTARVPPTTLTAQLGVGLHALAPAEIVPRGGAAFARRVGLAGPLFNSNNIGGYLIWSLYPEARVFQDSRLQAYPPEHFGEIMAASRSQDRWNALVAGVDWAMVSVPRANELSGAGRFPGRDWATVYFDEACEVLVRRSGRFAALVEPYAYRLLRPGFDPFAPLPAAVDDADRLVTEVQRNRADDPDGFAPAAWLCLRGGDADACTAADAIAGRRPELARAAVRLAHLRAAAEHQDRD